MYQFRAHDKLYSIDRPRGVPCRISPAHYMRRKTDAKTGHKSRVREQLRVCLQSSVCRGLTTRAHPFSHSLIHCHQPFALVVVGGGGGLSSLVLSNDLHVLALSDKRPTSCGSFETRFVITRKSSGCQCTADN